MSEGRAAAFAPASVGNVGVGFDILGFCVDVLGDRVTASVTQTPGVVITSITGVVVDLPTAAAQNTAGRAVESLLTRAHAGFGVALEIEKGIPLGSGLGGSAASAVAAVVAANALLPTPLGATDLLHCAMEGEAVASGAMHGDNVAPSLFGGLVLVVGHETPRVAQVPVPQGVRAVVVHPHMMIATREARAVLSPHVALGALVRQSGNLAGFIAGCYTGDIDLIRASFVDVLIEPQRQSLIPGFADARAGAMAAGALGCSISGAGPTMFAWVLAAEAENVRSAMQAPFSARGVATDAWVTDITATGARLLAP